MTDPDLPPLYRRVIRITAEDSPNVRLARRELQLGRDPTNRTVVPGVLTWREYVYRRRTWDKVRQCVGLDAQFYEGAENLLYPPENLNAAEALERVNRCRMFPTESIGVDPGEGGASTSLAAVNRYGLKELLSRKTPDTSVIPGLISAFMERHEIPPEKVCIDRGGGGKQIADRLRSLGRNVRTIAFGEPLVPDPRRGSSSPHQKKTQKEEKYTYFNRRAQMYGDLSQWLQLPTEEYNSRATFLRQQAESSDDPLWKMIHPDTEEGYESLFALQEEDFSPPGWENLSLLSPRRLGGSSSRRGGGDGAASLNSLPPPLRKLYLNKEFLGFAIPREYTTLRQELAVIPLTYDEEGRLYVLPKHRKDMGKEATEATRRTLIELIGHSPDELDALALALHGLIHKPKKRIMGTL